MPDHEAGFVPAASSEGTTEGPAGIRQIKHIMGLGLRGAKDLATGTGMPGAVELSCGERKSEQSRYGFVRNRE